MIEKIINKIKRQIMPYLIINKKKKLEKTLNKININEYKKIIIFENTFGWDQIMKQRPQQIALNMPDDVLFLYHSNKDKYSNKFHYKKIKKNLFLINLDIYRKYIHKYFKDITNKYLLIYSTSNIKAQIINNYIMNNFEIIYEYVDHFNEKLSGKRVIKKLIEDYISIISNKDNYIICTATKLYDNVLKDNPDSKVKLITNGCDYEHFKRREYAIPKEIKQIKKDSKPIVGYYGALGSWFDYELIKKIADTNKYSIILIGISYYDALNKSGILEFKNVHYLGKIDYDNLPKYSSYFDVSMIPFQINDITLSTSPVKVFEYMASEKPIVTTNLPECKKYKSILISKDHEEFINNLDKALKLSKDREYQEQLKKDALDNTWKSKCNEMIDFIIGSVE